MSKGSNLKHKTILFLKRFVFTFLILMTAFSLVYLGYLYGKSTTKKKYTKLTKKETTTSPTPLLLPTTQIASSGTKNNITPLTKSIQIPPGWKSFTDTDPQTKLTVSLTLPPGYKFRFTGSEWNIEKNGEEIWDYTSSIMLDKNGIPKNMYDGGSRRKWYQKYLNEEFLEEKPILKTEYKILSVIEHPIGNTSYLEITIKNPLSKKTETHFLYVQNGILHIIKPVSEKAYSKDSEIYKNINIILYSLKSRFDIK